MIPIKPLCILLLNFFPIIFIYAEDRVDTLFLKYSNDDHSVYVKTFQEEDFPEFSLVVLQHVDDYMLYKSSTSDIAQISSFYFNKEEDSIEIENIWSKRIYKYALENLPFKPKAFRYAILDNYDIIALDRDYIVVEEIPINKFNLVNDSLIDHFFSMVPADSSYINVTNYFVNSKKDLMNYSQIGYVSEVLSSQSRNRLCVQFYNGIFFFENISYNSDLQAIIRMEEIIKRMTKDTKVIFFR